MVLELHLFYYLINAICSNRGLPDDALYGTEVEWLLAPTSFTACTVTLL